jgi:hypothetical protein
VGWRDAARAFSALHGSDVGPGRQRAVDRAFAGNQSTGHQRMINEMRVETENCRGECHHEERAAINALEQAASRDSN